MSIEIAEAAYWSLVLVAAVGVLIGFIIWAVTSGVAKYRQWQTATLEFDAELNDATTRVDNEIIRMKAIADLHWAEFGPSLSSTTTSEQVQKLKDAVHDYIVYVPAIKSANQELEYLKGLPSALVLGDEIEWDFKRLETPSLLALDVMKELGITPDQIDLQVVLIGQAA